MAEIISCIVKSNGLIQSRSRSHFSLLFLKFYVLLFIYFRVSLMETFLNLFIWFWIFVFAEFVFLFR